MAWNRAGQSLANGQMSSLHGFSVFPLRTDKIPEVWIENRYIRASEDAGHCCGDRGRMSLADPEEDDDDDDATDRAGEVA